MNQKSFLKGLFICLGIGWLAGMVNQAQGQISEGGLPPSFRYPATLRSESKTIRVPVNFSVEDLKAVDAWQTSENGILRISTLIDTNIRLMDSADRITLSDGNTVYQLRIEAEEAIALMLYYKAFYIPEGARLFIYNPDRSQVLGAYTSETNPAGGVFATEFVAGDGLILEYVPAPSGEEPQIEIEQIGYGYNHLSVSAARDNDKGEISGSCMVNINCEEGEAWQEQKKGVCRTIQKIGDNAFLCSGTLINNTAEDMKPYILSAYHCSVDFNRNLTASAADLKQWVFYFHFEYSRCDNSSAAYLPKTMVGCSKIAFTPIEKGSDGLLLLLDQSIPSSYHVFFNGWDRTNRKTVSGAGLHHPGGDYMKISTFGNQLIGTSTWFNDDSRQQGATGAHWNVVFDRTPNGHGVTEGGSSGSPLFNKNQLVIGTLSGGNSSCEMPDGINLYGKLYYHWDKYGTEDSLRMDIWLDPLQTGATRLNGLSQSGAKTPVYVYPLPTDLTATRLGSSNVLLTWKAPVEKQIISWARENSLYQIGLEGEPFYFGQRWESSDLTALDRCMLTAVSFAPQPSSSYALFIQQGSRQYTQHINNPTYQNLMTCQLTTPFVIDADEELIVAVYAKRYDASVYPALTDEGPQVTGKGFIYSTDGQTWEYSDRQHDYNFVVLATVTSEKGEITNLRNLSASPNGPVVKKAGAAPAFRSVKAEGISFESMPVEAFEEVTGYAIYRNGAPIASLPASLTAYTDKQALGGSSVYEVSAVYGDEESESASVEIGSTVGIETPEGDDLRLSPTVFTDQIRLTNPSRVHLLTIYSAGGKVVRQIPHPDATIDTHAFPQGIYIFHLHTGKEVKVIQGIKQ